MITPAAGPRRRRRVPTWALVLLIPVAAAAPWLAPMPWNSGSDPVAADPSAIISQAKAAQPSATPGQPERPTSATIKTITHEINESGTSGYDQPVSAKAASAVSTVPGKYHRVGRIQIPRIGLDVSYGEGIYAAALDHGPGHWPGTPLPGEPGTAVLSGHRNTHTQPFKYLNLLAPGDKIIVSVGKGDPTTYRVDDTTIVPEAKYPAFVLKPSKTPQDRHLTLFACHPEGNPIFRIVIRATASADKGPSQGSR